MEEIIAILKEMKPGVEFTPRTDLLEEHILDSLKIVQLVAELNDVFDITVSPLDVTPDNFRTIESIWCLVQRLEDE